MPAGETGARNPPVKRNATAAGGTSGAEDTTRTAGYVTDFTKARAEPPGPPLAKDPASLVRPESVPPPPPARAKTPEEVAKATARDIERMDNESPAAVRVPPARRGGGKSR